MSSISFRSRTPVLLTLALCTPGASAHAQELSASSPNGRIQAFVSPSPIGASYRVLWNGRLAVLPSPLGIRVDGKNLAQNAALLAAKPREVRESYALRGGHKTAQNFYRETIFSSRGGGAQTFWQLEMRVFNDGVAMRYRVPATGQHHLDGETTGWKLPPGSVTWSQSSTDSYERLFTEQPLDSLASNTTVAAPLVAKLPGGAGYAFVSEANVVGYSDMALRVGNGGALSAQFDHDAGAGQRAAKSSRRGASRFWRAI